MKTSKEWDVTLRNGIITSEILDACAMTVNARMQAWYANIKDAQTALKKRPDSDARKRRLAASIERTRFYQRQLACLLRFTTPTAVTRTWNEATDEFDYFATYNVIDNTYIVPVTKESVLDMMERYDVDVMQENTAPTETGPARDCVSYYLVNRVIATSQIYGLDYQDTQNFDFDKKNWTPVCVTKNSKE